MSAARPPGTRFAALVLLVWIVAVASFGPRPACAQIPDTLGNSFARYVLFTDTHLAPDSGFSWFSHGAYFEGRVHTNTRFGFAYDPVFTDTVSSADPRAQYFNNGRPVTLSSDHNDTLDVPRFDRGLVLGAVPVALPTNLGALQSWAVGLPGVGPTAPTNQEIRERLGLPAGTDAPPDSVYLPRGAGGSLSGGIYVQGDVDQLVASIDSVAREQIWRIRQGARVVTITECWNTFVTIVDIDGQASTLSGVPRGVLWVNGRISDMRGPGREGNLPLPALLEGRRMSIAALNDIVLQGDVVREHHEAGIGALGILSQNAGVWIGQSAPNHAQLDAFVMALGPRGAFSVDQYDHGAPRGTFHLRGGVVSRYYGPFYTFNGSQSSGYMRDFRHDSRGVAPPLYPLILPSNLVSTPGPTIPARLSLSRPWPNPSRGTWHVRYSLPRAQHVRLALYDVMGRRVAPLVDAAQTAGEHEAWWRNDGARRLRPGMYLLLLESGGERARTKLVLIP